MSNEVTKACRPLQLPTSQKAVLMCLADYCHDDGRDWHSIAALMEWTCLGKTAVIEALKGLEQAGLIVRLHQGNGQRSATVVQLEAVAAAVQDQPNRCASRTGAFGEPVRLANPTGPFGGPEPVRLANQPVRQADPKHLQASVKHQTSTNARVAGVPGVGFEAFWEAYPRKVAKPMAMKAFQRHQVDDTLLQAMLSAIARQARSPDWLKEAGRFIPYPATWLNNRRWEDGGSGQGATADDTRPSWATRAGFPNRYEAENAGCFEHNASRFSGGRRLPAAAPDLSHEGST